MAKLQTLVQAVHLATTGKSRVLASAAVSLIGTMPGSGERNQAYRQMAALLPARSLRAYTAGQFLAATCYQDGSERWHQRDAVDAMREAARIEAESAEVVS